MVFCTAYRRVQIRRHFVDPCDDDHMLRPEDERSSPAATTTNLEIGFSRGQAFDSPTPRAQVIPIILSEWRREDELTRELGPGEPGRFKDAFLFSLVRSAYIPFDNVTNHPDLAHFIARTDQIFDEGHTLRLHDNVGFLLRFPDNGLDNIFIILQPTSWTNQKGSSMGAAVSDK